VPLIGRTLRVTGDGLLRGEVVLLAVDAAQNWHMLTFRVDSAIEITTLPAAAAKSRNIPSRKSPPPA
jgi:hypothetical protein